MIKHGTMQRKYFFRKLSVYLLCITLPIAILSTLIISYYRKQLHKELSSYVEQSRDFVLYNINSVLDVFLEETLVFSSTPSLAHAISKLLNEESLDYKNSVYKNLISSIISSSANLSDYVDSIYIYFDNPYGNYFDSLKDYTSINSPKSTDREWLSIYENTSVDEKQWITCRKVHYYSFQPEKNTISLFRRFDFKQGVMVINLDSEKIARILATNQLYNNAYTLITNRNGNVLYGSTGYNQLVDNVAELIRVDTEKSSTSFDSIKLNNVNYIYFTSEIPEYNLNMISLIPNDSVFKTVNSMILAFTAFMAFSILVSFALSFSITRNNFKQLQYNLLQLNLSQAKMKQKDAQLAALQLQINPHFIFNTLQTIDIEILRSQPVTNLSSKLIHNLSDILKYSLENTFKTVKIEDEISICKTYADIQKFRYENPFIIYYDYDDEVLKYPIIHLIFQPLLENCLHHGIKQLSKKGLVKIKLYKKSGYLKVYIIDNGVGIDKNQLVNIRRNLTLQSFNQTSHIGIYNTNLRLVLTYGQDAKIHINSKKGLGTIVSFSIPSEYFNYSN